MKFEIGDEIIIINGRYSGERGRLALMRYAFPGSHAGAWLVYKNLPESHENYTIIVYPEEMIKIKDLTELEKLIYNCK